MKNNKRSVNRKLINALIAYEGLDLLKIGQQCDPPVSRPAICMFLNGSGGYAPGGRLAKQIAEILRPGINPLFDELSLIHMLTPSELLFPTVYQEKEKEDDDMVEE